MARFYEHCSVDERLELRVVKDYRNTALRFLRFSKGEVSRESVRAYLQSYLTHAPKTYNNQLCGLGVFVQRFLAQTEMMRGLKKAHEGNNHETVKSQFNQPNRTSAPT